MDSHLPWDNLVHDIVIHTAHQPWAAQYWANGSVAGMDKTLRRLLQRRMSAWRTEHKSDIGPLDALPRASMLGLSILGHAAGKSPTPSSIKNKLKEHAAASGETIVLPLWRWLYQDSIRRQWTDVAAMARTARLSGIPMRAQDLRSAPVVNMEEMVSPRTHQWIATALVLGVSPCSGPVLPTHTPLPHLDYSV